jgi:hypothetical protein
VQSHGSDLELLSTQPSHTTCWFQHPHDATYGGHDATDDGDAGDRSLQ